MGPTDTQLGTGPLRAPAGETAVLGRYRIERLLGGGGCGLVYAGRHEILGKPVAIKMLRPELVRDASHSQRFFREARIAATLHHENIVDITDFGDEASDSPYLVMELLRGRTLMSVVRDAGLLQWQRVVSILIQLSRALACAHGQGVIHRDLKPHNIMLEDSSGRVDRVKLCDFGLSRLCNGNDRITATGHFVGTPAYMAPEQIRGTAQDARCDLYALAVTGFEMLTGSLPYAATNPVALVAEIISERRAGLRDRIPADVPDALVALIERCLAFDPNARPQTALEIESDLLAITSHPVPAASDMVGHVIGSYRITAPLGTGGSGSVWLAEHQVIGTKVAIKVLRPEIASLPGVAERFVNEARATGLIQSPYIARYLDLGRLPSGQPYAILEYLEGETLFDRLERRVRLPVGEALMITRQIASALVQAHAANIIHRDIKPENVFLATGDNDLVAKVLDFGIAKMSSAGGNAPQTRLGFFMGTIEYCPPEQVLGDAAGPQADVYALGATLFHLLVGHTPFTGDSTEIAVAKTTHAAPPLQDARSDVPRHVAALVDSMLALQASDRPTMAAVLDRLTGTPPAGRVIVERPHTTDSSALFEIPRRLRPRTTRMILAGGVATIALALFVLWPSSPRVPVREVPKMTVTPLPEPAAPAPAPAPAPAEPTIVPAPAVIKVQQQPRRTEPKHAVSPKPAKPATIASPPKPIVPSHTGDHPPDVIIANPFGAK